MRLVFMYLACGVLSLQAQIALSARQANEISGYFEHESGEKPLACSVRFFHPSLSFAFRIQSGYFADVPLKQIAGEKRSLAVMLRVASEQDGSQPYYFFQRADFKKVPDRTKAVAQLSGGLFFGEGRYRVDLVVTDDDQRVCRKQWKLEAKLSGKERQIKVLQEPGTVQPVVLPQWAGSSSAADTSHPLRATIFLNVAPLRSRSLRLSIFDRALMFGTLKAVLEQSPFTSVRIVAFNLERHQEIFRQERLDPRGFDELRNAIQEVSLATIDVSVLRQPKGHLDLLSKLVKEELAAAQPSDAVIFIGPNAHRQDRLPEDWPATGGANPRFFYLEYAPYLGGTFPDVIARAVRSFDGKWYPVRSPQELATALKKMERALVSPSTANGG